MFEWLKKLRNWLWRLLGISTDSEKLRKASQQLIQAPQKNRNQQDTTSNRIATTGQFKRHALQAKTAEQIGQELLAEVVKIIDNYKTTQQLQVDELKKIHKQVCDAMRKDHEAILQDSPQLNEREKNYDINLIEQIVNYIEILSPDNLQNLQVINPFIEETRNKRKEKIFDVTEQNLLETALQTLQTIITSDNVDAISALQNFSHHIKPVPKEQLTVRDLKTLIENLLQKSPNIFLQKKYKFLCEQKNIFNNDLIIKNHEELITCLEALIVFANNSLCPEIDPQQIINQANHIVDKINNLSGASVLTTLDPSFNQYQVAQAICWLIDYYKAIIAIDATLTDKIRDLKEKLNSLNTFFELDPHKQKETKNRYDEALTNIKENYVAYVKEMGNWGNNPEISALAKILKADITIISLSSGGEAETVFNSPIQPPQTTIKLCYGGGHYQAYVEVNGKETKQDNLADGDCLFYAVSDASSKRVYDIKALDSAAIDKMKDRVQSLRNEVAQEIANNFAEYQFAILVAAQDASFDRNRIVEPEDLKVLLQYPLEKIVPMELSPKIQNLLNEMVPPQEIEHEQQPRTMSP